MNLITFNQSSISCLRISFSLLCLLPHQVLGSSSPLGVLGRIVVTWARCSPSIDCADVLCEPRSRGCAEYSIIIICCWSGSREYQLRSVHWPLLCYPMVTVRCTALPAICGVLSIVYISLYFKSNRLSIEKTITIHIQKIHGNGRPKKFIQYNVCDM